MILLAALFFSSNLARWLQIQVCNAAKYSATCMLTGNLEVRSLDTICLESTEAQIVLHLQPVAQQPFKVTMDSPKTIYYCVSKIWMLQDPHTHASL